MDAKSWMPTLNTGLSCSGWKHWKGFSLIEVQLATEENLNKPNGLFCIIVCQRAWNNNKKKSILAPSELFGVISGQSEGHCFYFYTWPTSSSTWSHTPQPTGSYLSGVQSQSSKPEDSPLGCCGLMINTNHFNHSLWHPLTNQLAPNTCRDLKGLKL